MNAYRRLRWSAAAAALALLAACQAPPTSTSITQLYQRPAEHALIDGLRYYEGGEFQKAEASLSAAVTGGLADPRDVAVAYKYLAFIACAFNRGTECALDFTQAFTADPSFHLNDTEIGHPLWGPVYRRVEQAMKKSQAAARPQSY
jgi:Tfp pilus assembly protein PilF